jgi:hypothetical protein
VIPAARSAAPNCSNRPAFCAPCSTPRAVSVASCHFSEVRYVSTFVARSPLRPAAPRRRTAARAAVLLTSTASVCATAAARA